MCSGVISGDLAAPHVAERVVQELETRLHNPMRSFDTTGVFQKYTYDSTPELVVLHTHEILRSIQIHTRITEVKRFRLGCATFHLYDVEGDVLQ